MYKIVDTNSETAKTKFFHNLYDACYFFAEQTVDFDAYNDLIDECYNTYEIMGMEYSPSYVFKTIDPIAYECSYDDYLDGVASDYYYELGMIDAEKFQKGYDYVSCGYTIYEIEGGAINE
jgi:hypothetical protein